MPTSHPNRQSLSALHRQSGGRHPVAVVTGANHGIGAATARALAKSGARVLVAGLPIVEEPDPATPDAYYVSRARTSADVADAIRADGGEATAIDQDLLVDGAAEVLLDTAEAAFGDPVSILVHNATGWVGDTFAASGSDEVGRSTRSVTAESFDQQFGVDARAGALLIAEYARRARRHDRNWGRVVTLSSGGPDGFPNEASYGAAKAALDNYAMTASAELASTGITVNIVVPPITDTGWVTDAVREIPERPWKHHHIATPEEVAGVITWLCSDASWLVTGNRIVLR